MRRHRTPFRKHNLVYWNEFDGFAGAFAGRGGVGPAAGRLDVVVDFFGAPGAGVVGVDGRVGFQNGVDDAPGFFDVVLAGELGWVAGHGVAEEDFVGLHFIGLGVVMREQFGLLADEGLAGGHHGDAERDVDVGADAEAQIILLRAWWSESSSAAA